MTIRDDLKARVIQAAAGRLMRVPADLKLSGADLPPPEAMLAETEEGPVPVTVYRPAGAGEAPPLYIHFHGGGFVIGAPEQDDHVCRHIAAELGAVVLNVDYAVAPQHRFPVAATQAQALAWWAVHTGRKHGWDGKRIALGGASAGGNLAIGACLELPARMGFRAKGVAAVYPVLDLATAPEDKPSTAARPLISPKMARVFDAAYVPDKAARAAPLVSPLLAPDLKGFPPTLLAVAEHDSLRAEAERFAGRLTEAGGAPELHLEAGVDHGYLQRGPRPAVVATMGAVTGFLARVLA